MLTVIGPAVANRLWPQRNIPGLAFLTPNSDSLSRELEMILMVESGLRGGDQKAGEPGLVAVPKPYTRPNLLATLAYDEGEPEADSEPDPEDSESDPVLDNVDHSCCGVVA